MYFVCYTRILHEVLDEPLWVMGLDRGGVGGRVLYGTWRHYAPGDMFTFQDLTEGTSAGNTREWTSSVDDLPDKVVAALMKLELGAPTDG